ncbi:MAG TPA: SDR family NAD(P)-dependent oxidoreductase [Anaerolineales bacterium]|nr:SDR family NAD(P)-dependent oxidoreductase [Anaerolineales bacterium]
MKNFKNKVILITGAGKGGGSLLAKAFAEGGAIVAANDISPINVEEVMDRIVAEGGRGKAYIEDVAKKVGTQHLIKQVEDDLGRIDVLINHAAVEPYIQLLDMDEWDWHRVMDVNLTGAFLMIQSVGRVMRAQGSGVIINLITAPDSRVKNAPADDQREGRSEAAFVASMHGLRGLTLEAARELDPYGIRVYAVENRGDKIVEDVFALLQLNNA